jgi:hypothetical protein
MEPVALHVHSVVDQITNSSTVIYTYEDGSLEPCRQMIDELLRAFGVDRKCDDAFYLRVRVDADRFVDWVLDRGEELPAEFDGLVDSQLVDKLVEVGNLVPWPEWYAELQRKVMHNGGRYEGKPGTCLEIIPKAPEHQAAADAIVVFLRSPSNESVYNG